jgi:DDE family transposase/transposase IS4-like protein
LPVHDASSGWRLPVPAWFSPASLGVLSWFVPPGLAGEVLAQARAEAAGAAGPGLPARRLRLLPPLLGLYFTLALCLSSYLPYQQVLGGMCGLGPASTALTGLRRRVGARPLELLFARVAGHLSAGREPWSHVCGLLVVAWDGTTLKLPASPQNTAWAGRREKESHYPRARLVALAACGTRCLLAAAAGPSATGERKLAAGLTGLLRPGMLLLADRGFYSWGLWNAAAASGAQLLWRVQGGGLHLPPVLELPDGSFLSRIEDRRAKDNRYRKNGKRRRAGRAPDTSPLPAVTVRVIEFTLTVAAGDGTTRAERYRMITTLLDHRAAPAAALAAAYARRWAIETCFSELKTRLRGPGRILRSRTPALALQETWAYLVTYQAIRAVIARTAAGAGLDPARLSFTTALHALRASAGLRPADALARAEAALLAAPVPDRPGRVRPRALREPGPSYPRATTPDPLPRHATYSVTITPPPAQTRTQPSQHQHRASQAEPPP